MITAGCTSTWAEMLPALLADGGPGGVYPVKVTVYRFPPRFPGVPGDVQLYVVCPNRLDPVVQPLPRPAAPNKLDTFELALEKLPPSLPFSIRTDEVAPEAVSFNCRAMEYAPLVESISGVLDGAVLDTRRLVTATSELLVAFLPGSLVNVTVPVPGESADTNDCVGVKL